MKINTIYTKLVFPVVLSLTFFGARVGCAEPAPHDSSRWEKAIKKFERQDAKQAPPQQANLFVGSSSIRRWSLPKYFPDHTVINRGFGGSQFADAANFAERIVIKHRPRVVVLFSGDNDINSGKSPEQVHKDFLAFTKKVKKSLPQAKIVCIGIKPSPSRWRLANKNQAANRLIREECEKDDSLVHISVWDKMLRADGNPRTELFVEDGLHLSHEGYQLWAELVEPHLAKRKDNSSQ